MGRQRLGILGGTFDPIHNGHLMIARAMLDKLGLDRILFIPDYIPPHKRGWHCSPSADRLAMTILAAAEDPRYTVSPMELDRGGVSYTCDTLRQLYRKWHRFYDLYFIIGADSAEQLPTWHHIREAMTYATFAAAARPGFAPHKEKVSEELARHGLRNLVWVETPELDISSTAIRERIRKGEPVDTMIPKAVAEYIEQRDLYRQ